MRWWPSHTGDWVAVVGDAGQSRICRAAGRKQSARESEIVQLELGVMSQGTQDLDREGGMVAKGVDE